MRPQRMKQSNLETFLSALVIISTDLFILAREIKISVQNIPHQLTKKAFSSIVWMCSGSF